MSTISAYYNENDQGAAEWLKNLMDRGLITKGYIDTRSIHEVKPEDVAGYDRVHFFAGIAGWELALNLAEWGDRPVWTGSAPCQPYSLAGKRKAQSDERHLWPEMFRLMRDRKPIVTFGEQVTSAIGFGWLDGICDDLEAEGYEVGSAVLGAFSVGAPHKRSRLYWVANSSCERRNQRWSEDRQHVGNVVDADRSGSTLAKSNERRPHGRKDSAKPPESQEHYQAETGCRDCSVVNATGKRFRETRLSISDIWSTEMLAGSGAVIKLGNAASNHEQRNSVAAVHREWIETGGSSVDSYWSDSRIIHCTDGKSRRVGRSVFPLAPRIPRTMGSGQPELSKLVRRARSNRVGRLRGYGNAICVPLAAEFIRAYMETEKDPT